MNILITRPSPEGEELVNKLLDIGKFAHHLPLIYFSQPKNSSLINKINSLSKGDFLFLVSKNAVKYAHSQLLKMGLSWPSIIEYYSIGQKTSSIMYKLSGISSKYPQRIETSENLMQLLTHIHNNKISGRRALILKGNNGRTFLKQTLKKKGVFTLSCTCYTRKILQYNGEEQVQILLKLNINTIVVTTEEILKQLYYLIPQSYRMTWLIQCKLIVVSSRLSILAKHLGWTNIIITESANNAAIIRTLQQNT